MRPPSSHSPRSWRGNAYVVTGVIVVALGVLALAGQIAYASDQPVAFWVMHRFVPWALLLVTVGYAAVCLLRAWWPGLPARWRLVAPTRSEYFAQAVWQCGMALSIWGGEFLVAWVRLLGLVMIVVGIARGLRARWATAAKNR